MPKPAAHLPSGVRGTDIFTVTSFATVFPMSTIQEILDRHNCGTIRVRLLTSELTVYFVMMLALFRDSSHTEVYRCVKTAFDRLLKRNSASPVPTSSALAQAREKIVPEAFQDIFEQCVKPLAKPGSQGSFFKHWRKVAFDGCLLNTEDTDKNRNFFGSATNHTDTLARSPQVRFVGLIELGTHAFLAASIGGYHDGEINLALNLIHRIEPDMICITDRNFYSFDFFKTISNTGAALLMRVQKGIIFTEKEQLSDNSYLVEIFSAADTNKKNGIIARFFQYQVKGSTETFFMITNILDPVVASAEELAALYHERWEYEGVLDELKTHLNTNALVLRSKSPSLVIQELWGMLMTHYVVRKTMYLAAETEDLDPDRVSFIHTVRVLKRTLVTASVSPPEKSQEVRN